MYSKSNLDAGARHPEVQVYQYSFAGSIALVFEKLPLDVQLPALRSDDATRTLGWNSSIDGGVGPSRHPGNQSASRDQPTVPIRSFDPLSEPYWT
jgi:hypothetical protein